jgi:hypothetical protein
MKRRPVLLIALFLFTAGLTTSASIRHNVVARFSARTVQMTGAARPVFARVDINIAQWSTDQDHRLLGRTIQEQGPMGVSYLLAGYPSLGTISVFDREFIIRYAWQVNDRDGGQRVYLATAEPIQLTSREFTRFADPEPLTFLELRLDNRGEGMGKLSEVTRLSVDESRNVIELRDYDGRPLHLVMVHDELNFID